MTSPTQTANPIIDVERYVECVHCMHKATLTAKIHYPRETRPQGGAPYSDTQLWTLPT